MSVRFVLVVVNTTDQTTSLYIMEKEYKWWTSTLYSHLKRFGGCYTVDRYPLRNTSTRQAMNEPSTNELMKECSWRAEHWTCRLPDGQDTNGLFHGTIYQK